MTTEEAVNEVLNRQRFIRWAYLINRLNTQDRKHSNAGKQTPRSPVLWELPALRPSGGAQSFWPWYYIYKYYIIYYYIICRAPGVANGNIHFILHAAVHPGLNCTEFDGWTLIGCYVTHVTQWPRCWTLIGCHHAKFASKFKYFNSSEFVAPQILVNTLACARRKCGATNQNLSPVFSREKFARYASIRSLCMGSCRPVAYFPLTSRSSKD